MHGFDIDFSIMEKGEGIMAQKIEQGSLEIWRERVGAVRTNCYLILDAKTRDAVLVDPADNWPAILAMQKKADAHVLGILLTHGHFDHITAAKEAADGFHAEIYAAEAERELLADANLNRSGMFGRTEVALEADHWLNDGDSLRFGSLSFVCLHTPGHTGGGLCFYFAKDGLLCSGDTLFRESLGRTDLPTGNEGKLMQSVNEKLMVLPEETLVLPGHGSRTMIGYEKENNPYINGNLWE